jgi:hypothetical protein
LAKGPKDQQRLATADPEFRAVMERIMETPEYKKVINTDEQLVSARQNIVDTERQIAQIQATLVKVQGRLRALPMVRGD